MRRFRSLPVTRPRTYIETGAVHVDANLVEAAFGQIVRTIAQQILMVNFLAERRNGVFQRLLADEGVFLAAGVARQDVDRIVGLQPRARYEGALDRARATP